MSTVRGAKAACIQQYRTLTVTAGTAGPVDRAQILRLIAHYLPARAEKNVSGQTEKGTTEATDAIDRQSLLDRCGGSESFAHERLTRFRKAGLPRVIRC